LGYWGWPLGCGPNRQAAWLIAEFGKLSK